jgi:hypothetical protein
MYEFFMNLEDKWKKAEKDLEEFNESIKLIKQFPIKPFKEVNCLPYEIEGHIEYPSA